MTNTGGGSIELHGVGDAAWLSVSPASGDAPATVTVTPHDHAALAAGTLHGDVTSTRRGRDRLAQDGPGHADRQPARHRPRRRLGLRRGDRHDDRATRPGAATPAPSPAPTRTTAGRFGGALSFDGVNDWVTVADANSLDLTTGMTLEAWVSPTAIGGAGARSCSRSGPATSTYALYAADDAGRAGGHVFTTAERRPQRARRRRR